MSHFIEVHVNAAGKQSHYLSPSNSKYSKQEFEVLSAMKTLSGKTLERFPSRRAACPRGFSNAFGRPVQCYPDMAQRVHSCQ